MIDVIITACSRQTMRQALKLSRRGWTNKRVAKELGICIVTMDRYFRVYDKYGIKAFIPLVPRKQ